MIGSALAAAAALLKIVLTWMGFIRDDKLRQEGAIQADHERRIAVDSAVEKAQAIEDRPQPDNLKDSLKRLAVACFMLGLAGCASAPLTIRADVDCPVLGKLLLMPQPAKDWLLAQPSVPPEMLAFTNAVGTHNEKVREICRSSPQE